MMDLPIRVFSTCSQSSAVSSDEFATRVAQVSKWSEQYGCTGILAYTDNSLVDAWALSQLIIHNTSRLCPLVAVQPVYMHPYSVAKMVSTFAFLYCRRVYLNMVAGGFKNDLVALGDTTPHDRRYARLTEYTTIVKRLLACAGPISYEGEFYRVQNLSLAPPLPATMVPEIFVSGSSDAGYATATALGATAILYPRPAAEYEVQRSACDGPMGIRVGIIARTKEEEAWRVAYERFPQDRRGQLAHHLAMKTSDSVWHKQLASVRQDGDGKQSPYWLWPFENYKSFCPYLVGSYETVAGELAQYARIGHRTFILDIPPSEEELYHTSKVFRLVTNKGVELDSCFRESTAPGQAAPVQAGVRSRASVT